MKPSSDSEFTARLDASSCAVVVIDAQNDFCHPDGVQAGIGKDVERLVEPLERLESFLSSARRHGVPVVFVQNIYTEAVDSAEWRLRHPQSDRPKACRSGTWGADFCGGGPQAGDVVVQKHRYSAFAGPGLADALEGIGRSALIFTGFATSICVESSLREAVCRDYVATLVEDCTGDYSQEAHDRALQAVANGFGLVATSGEIVSHWEQSSSPSSSAYAAAHSS